MPPEVYLFRQTLIRAAQRIAPLYFQPPIPQSVDSQYRERVYCYELYHQLRSVWPQGLAQYTLGGEVDKNGHPFIGGDRLDKVKPDLIVHVPGTMTSNLAVVEVKAGLPSAADVGTDISKLWAFCDGAEYTAGLFIVYGIGASQTATLLNRCAAALRVHDADARRLHLLVHECAGSEPIVYFPFPA
jgi:hypothetical protein